MPVETCQKYTATLSEILALTPVVQTIADATDVPGVRLEWMNGAWYGDCGFPSAAQHSALLAANAYNSLALGAKATLPSGPVTWRGAGCGWRVQADALDLVSLYDAQDAIDSVWGFSNEPRASLPSANDTPTITASQTAPASDSDPCGTVFKLMGNATDGSDTAIIPFSSRSDNRFLRGHNRNVCSRNNYGDSLFMCRGVNYVTDTLTPDSDALIEPGSIWVMSAAKPVIDFYLDGDVVILRHAGWSGNGDFCLFVNGSLVTVTPGSWVTKAASGISYHLGTGGTSNAYLKIKFPTWGKRRITIKPQGTNTPVRIYTRNTSQISPVVESPLTWLHFGCSFSDFTISDSGASCIQMTMTEWMHSKFGFKTNFINLAIGGTSLGNGANNQILPTTQQPYIVGKSASQRKALVQQSAGLDADVITFLAGHNDSAITTNPLVASELAAWIADAKRMHPRARVLIIFTDASPGMISAGYDVLVENLMASVCAANGADFVRLQTQTPPTMTGTGCQGAETGVGNSDRYTGPDGVHPTIAGHKMYGLLLAKIVRNWLAKR